MRPPNKQAAGTWGTGGSQKNSGLAETTERDIKHLARGIQVGSINKGRGSALRVSLSSWRGLHRIEVVETTELLSGSGAYFPAGSGVKVPVDLVDELIDALTAAKAKAISLGLFSEGRARP